MQQQTIAAELETNFAGHDAAARPQASGDDRWPLPYAALFILGSSVAAWVLVIAVGMAIFG